MDRCPDCNSDRVIPGDDGYICCSCGCEFGTTRKNKFHTNQIKFMKRLHQKTASAPRQ